MSRYVALLRGINVSGQKKILMSDLRGLFENVGFTDVVTYIQSGNVLFTASEQEALELRISEAIKVRYGWEVPVLVIPSEGIHKILYGCPFTPEKKVKSYFVLLHEYPSEEDLQALRTVHYEGEEFEMGDKCIYFYSAGGYGKAKLNNNFFEKKLRVKATTRNFKTLLKLTELASS